MSKATVAQPRVSGRSPAARESRVRARRAAILRAAAAIMVRTGYHEMSMQAVAEWRPQGDRRGTEVVPKDPAQPKRISRSPT